MMSFWRTANFGLFWACFYVGVVVLTATAPGYIIYCMVSGSLGKTSALYVEGHQHQSCGAALPHLPKLQLRHLGHLPAKPQNWMWEIQEREWVNQLNLQDLQSTHMWQRLQAPKNKAVPEVTSRGNHQLTGWYESRDQRELTRVFYRSLFEDLSQPFYTLLVFGFWFWIFALHNM